jgi:glycosyltransferase involved in cell wall biosynthesis
VIMANYNGGRFIEAAIASVLAQTLRDLELIVSDDASSDDCLSRVFAIAAHDQRIRVIRSFTNTGPGEARNRALHQARGRWIAVVDSDDLIHPERLERLITAAEKDGADLAADDLLVFSNDQKYAPFNWLKNIRGPQWLGLAAYIRLNSFFLHGMEIGYLKPVFSAALLARTGVRFNQALPVGEDYDFVLRLLAAGARFRVYPELTYFYRKHQDSISYRISRTAIESALECGDAFYAGLGRVEHASLNLLHQLNGYRSLPVWG